MTKKGTPTEQRAQKRVARFAAAQAQLTPEQLAEQQRQNWTTSRPPIVHTTANELKMAQRWFREFMHDQHPDVDVNKEYFTAGCAPASMALLKEYARYLVRSRVGRIMDKVNVNTMQHYMAMTISILERRGEHPLHTFSKHFKELRNFVRNDLVQQEGVSTEMHTKAVAHSLDFTFIISQLYTPAYLNTFSNMRNVYNLTLWMNLLVDVCGRGSEISLHNQRPKHMCLRWEDIEFYTFQNEEDDSFDIRANITIRWSKGQTNDDSAYRVIPLPGLLPLSMALQDSLQLLLVGALMDGVLLDGVQSWDDLYRLRVPAEIAKTGRRIPKKQDMLQVPVLRKLKKHRLTTDPVLTNEMQAEIRRLGEYCGLEHRLTTYCMRRGVAYMLAAKTTETNRKYLMGHSMRSEVFSSAYISRISTIDFAAMFRALDSHPVEAQFGISLNRSSEAPAVLSAEAQESILLDADIQAISRRLDELRVTIRTRHPSLTAAARTEDPLWIEYKDAVDERVSRSRLLAKRLHAQEYREHFKSLTVTPSKPAEEEEEEEEEEEGPSDTMEQAFQMIDSQLLTDDSPSDEFVNDITGDTSEQILRQTTAAVPGELATLVESASGGELDAIQTDDVQTMRLHGLAVDVYGTRGKNRMHHRGRSAFNDMLADLQLAESNEAAAAVTLTTWFSVNHGIDEFPPGQEPLPLTYDCRFCGKDLEKFDTSYDHTHACAKADATKGAQALFDSISSLDDPCTYQKCGTGKQKSTFVACDQTFTDPVTKGRHMRKHYESMEKNNADGEKVLSCFFGDCATNAEGGKDERDGPEFASREAQTLHLWHEHGISISKAKQTVVPEYCHFCQIWLLEPREWLKHADQHLDDVQAIISQVGYNGVRAGRLIVPRVCPFCYHNEDLPASLRVYTYSRHGFQAHLGDHLSTLKTTSSEVPCPAHPSMCAKAEPMDVVQMACHLRDVHSMDVPERFTKGSNPLADITNTVAANGRSRKKAKYN